MFNNNLKKIAVAALVLMSLAGCGGTTGGSSAPAKPKVESVDGTYTFELSSAELAGNTAHNGFVTAMGLTQKNTVELKGAKYEYTKQLAKFGSDGKPSSDSAAVTYTFYGDYKNSGNKVTLSPPKSADFDENWGDAAKTGYLKTVKGSTKNNDKVTPKEGESYDPLSAFPTPYYVFSKDKITAVEIKIDKSAKTFTYGEVKNSDDE